MLEQLDVPILGSANLDDDGSYGFVNDNVEDYITLDVDGLDVAIFGLTNPRVYRYELPTNIEGLSFFPATMTAQSLVPTILADEDPDLLIGLTHVGYQPYGGEFDSDQLVAEGVAGIDVIVGGHSHTRLDPAVMVTSDVNPEGTLVGHAYKYAQYLGKINVGFTGNMTDGYEIVLREGYLLPAGDVDPDPDLTTYLEPFVGALDAYTGQEIGQTTAPVDALEAYTEETSGANVQCDAAVFELAQHGIDVDFHLSGAMSNRKVADDATQANPVTLTIADMYTLMPYENSLVAMSMNGPQIKRVLERAYRNYYYFKYVEDYGGYSHYTTCMLDINEGGVITYKDRYPALPDGDNVQSLVFNGTSVDFTDADTYYNVSTVNYLAAGSCNFNDDGVTIWPLDQITADTQYYVRDSVITYITDMGTISPQVEGRLQWTYNRRPSNGTVTPSSGSGPAGVTTYFNTTWSDPDGWEDLKHVYFHIGASASLYRNVTLMYNVHNNKLWMRSDDGSTWLGGYAPWSDNVIENLQAKVFCVQSRAEGSGDTLTVTWAIKFKAAFRGVKKTGLKCKDLYKANSKGAWMGTWNVY
jgi:2',3'-cyclic-nucleotide 2'-phosphodiesterase (5'-nucleotidase family)